MAVCDFANIDRTCQAILQGHTSLVGQLQMRGNTLVTGGSDGSVRVWSLEKMAPIHRLAAHDNSVTSLQFDDTRVVSGGSDGRVKVWDLKTGQLVRELTAPADAVWRVAFEEEKCVVMASRASRTIMEARFSPLPTISYPENHITNKQQVWSFSPPEEITYDLPTTTAQRLAARVPPRPASAIEYRSDQTMTGLHMETSMSQPHPTSATSVGMRNLSIFEAESDRDDVEMKDASPGEGPSTAPAGHRYAGPTFFNEND